MSAGRARRLRAARPRFLRTAAATLVLMFVVVLSGCSAYYLGEKAPELSKESVTGEWSHEGPAGVTASVILAADGNFTATSIPQISTPSSADIRSGTVKDDTVVDWSVLEHGSGTWTIHDNSDGSAPAVDLTYAVDDSSLARGPMSGGHYSALLSLEEAGSARLFFYAGDADEKYRFLLKKQ